MQRNIEDIEAMSEKEELNKCVNIEEKNELETLIRVVEGNVENIQRAGSTGESDREKLGGRRKLVYHCNPEYDAGSKNELLSKLKNKYITEPTSKHITVPIMQEESKCTVAESKCTVGEEHNVLNTLTCSLENSNSCGEMMDDMQGVPEEEVLTLHSDQLVNSILNQLSKTVPINSSVSKIEVNKEEYIVPRSKMSGLIEKSVNLSEEIIDNFKIIEEDLRGFSMMEVQKREMKLLFPSGKSTNKSVILDMDETLIHSLIPEFKYYPNIEIDKNRIIGMSYYDPINKHRREIEIVIRPYAEELLRELAPLCEIIVFTAAEKAYADVILDYLDPSREFINHRIYREKCIQVNEHNIKDLRIFSNRSLHNLIIVDNSILSFSNQMENGIPVSSFYAHPRDSELKILIHYLKQLLTLHDVRTSIKNKFQMTELLQLHSNY